MSREMEALAADALAGAAAARRGPHPHPAACANCGHLLYGRYCSQCGQSSDLRHRSIVHLIWEAFESLLHLDGRLWRTVPALFFRPGTLARDYLEGRLARHVPPFRMFLVALVIVVFATEHAVHEFPNNNQAHGKISVGGQEVHGRVDAAAKMRVRAAKKYDERVAKAAERRGEDLANPARHDRAEADYQRAMKTAADKRTVELQGADTMETGKGGSSYFRGVGLAIERPEYFRTVLFEWAHRLAVLLLPITAGFLTLLYIYKRKFYVYDHLIVAMDYLSFVFLLDAAVFLLPHDLQPWGMLVGLIWSPINLFMTLRGAYGSSIIGAALKSLLLAFLTALSFLALVVGLIIFTLYQL
jgi:hypothetical protein